MPGDKEARVRVGIDGADEVASAARRAIDPWRQAGEAVAGSFRRAGQAISSQLGQIGMDMLRTVTVMRTLDMRSAVEGARAYREEMTRFGITAGESVGTVRVGFEQLSKMTLEGEPALAAWSKGVGRLTYDYVGAIVSAKALHDESIATGKSFEEMGQLGVVMHNALGVTDDMDKALGKIRAQAEALGTIGGVAAFQDQIQALGSVLTGVAVHSDEARDRITALAGILGRGYRPAQAQQIQQSVLSQLQGRATFISRSLGFDVLNEQGEIADPAKVIRDLKRHFERFIPDRFTRLTALRTYFGNLAGSAVYRGDFSEQAISGIAGLAPSGGAASATDSFAQSDAGRARANELVAHRKMREMAEGVVAMQDKFGATFAEHPLAGQMVGQLSEAVLRYGAQNLGALFAGGGAAGGAGGTAAAEAGLAGLTVGLSGATIALGAFAVGLAATGKVLSDLGEGSKVHQGFDAVALTHEKAKELSGKAKAAEEAAPGERSEGMQHAFELEQVRLRGGRARELLSAYEVAYRHQEAPKVGRSLLAATEGPNADPVLRELREELKGGRIDPTRLPKDIAEAMVQALATSPLKAVLQVAPGGVQPPEKPDRGRN